jgi:DsbC/DsbD-like thiol-disulfide interchange protein
MMPSVRLRLARAALVVGMLAAAVIAPHAQHVKPKAELTPTVETAAVHAGGTVHLALKVKLRPENVHVQSNKPRDPAFIPTVLTIDAPAGATVGTIRYPPARDLKQQGQQTPLAVYGPEFTINVDVTLAKSAVAGNLAVPAHLKYQACDEAVCYPPAKADTQWTLPVK